MINPIYYINNRIKLQPVNIKFRRLYYRPRYIQRKICYCMVWNISKPCTDISGIIKTNNNNEVGYEIGIIPENVMDISCVVSSFSEKEENTENMNCLDDFIIDYPSTRKKITHFLKPPSSS